MDSSGKLENKSEIANIFNVYVFQPKEEFYNLNFEAKLKILEENITLVKNNIKTNNENSPLNKNIFVAPEYLFKDFTKRGGERYFSQEEKNKYKKALIKLSEETDLILIPGTICWKKKSKADSNMYYRNMLYVIHNGTIQKYKKRYPSSLYDFDFTGGKIFNRKFFKEGQDDNVIKVNDIYIGVEICLDNPRGALKSSSSYDKMNVHLIVADGIADSEFLKSNKEGLLLKVERTEKYSSIIAQQSNMPTELKPPEIVENINEVLKRYTFSYIQLKNENIGSRKYEQ